MNITWGNPPDRKLQKRVHYSPTTPQHHHPVVNSTSPQTPESSPSSEKDKPKRGILSILKRRPSHSAQHSLIPGTDGHRASSPTPSNVSGQSWHHHTSYFPDYDPIYPTTTFIDPYASAFGLTAAQAQAQAHSAAVGHAVSIHYPMLPSFAEYNQGGGAKLQGAGVWQNGSGSWGNADWTGYGLNGERLPDTEGKTFGAPMPKGVPLEEEKKKGGGGGGGKKKGKGGGGEDGEGDGEEGEGEEGGEGGGEGEGGDKEEGGEGGGGEAAAGGGGGGGGAKKKNKKKK